MFNITNDSKILITAKTQTTQKAITKGMKQQNNYQSAKQIIVSKKKKKKTEHVSCNMIL